MVGDNCLEFDGDTSIHCDSQATTKYITNSIISTAGATFMTIDMKDNAYNTPMSNFEYMTLPLKLVPTEIIDQYNLKELTHNGMIYVEIRKGIPGLKRIGKIAYSRQCKRL